MIWFDLICTLLGIDDFSEIKFVLMKIHARLLQLENIPSSIFNTVGGITMYSIELSEKAFMPIVWSFEFS